MNTKIGTNFIDRRLLSFTVKGLLRFQSFSAAGMADQNLMLIRKDADDF